MRKGLWVSLFQVARVQFLIGGLVLYLLGALWAMLQGSLFNGTLLILGLLIVLSAQLSVHFSNDYFDASTDGTGGQTFISGGSGVLQEHPEWRSLVKWIAVGLLLFSILLALLLTLLALFPLWLFALILIGNLLGWFYSAPPVRLSRTGLGEMCYLFNGGFLASAVGYYAVHRALDAPFVFFLLPLLLAAAITMCSVEMPDVEDDRLAHKRNWVTRLGRPAGFWLAGSMLLALTAYFFFAEKAYTFPGRFHPWVVGVESFLPLGFGLTGMIRRPRDRSSATRIATGIVISLAIFSLLVDGYLAWLVIR
jgi:1,4-dihydroxy-2-naphthoate polyprenyltransferase